MAERLLQEWGGSTCVRRATYDPKGGRLVVSFVNGPGTKEYSFVGVPPDVWERFLKAESKGRYYHQFIRGRYRDPAAG